ncbi:hypothetical protein [Sphingomonas sp.]|jgi:type III secretion protein L|uniref:hypothetical protein n=1 Tax=Sphingomonas sp. TaxID=28214 RepID=UPI002E32431F|nr:hypothetical protein [Sphingomonas sp.]HEX4695797.1 hypothetical protein [Sphingomonas sp.]
MTGLIKRASAGDAAMPLPRPATVAATDTETLTVDPRIAELETEVARLQAELADERRAAAEAIAVARLAGRGDAAADDEGRTAAVERGLGDALAAWTDRLAEIDRLAVMLARTALAKVFGDDDDRADRVARTIAHHLGRLGEQAVIGVRVSAADFADEQLAALDSARGRVATDAVLAAGECRIDLKLGAIDVDPALQWVVLDRALAELERAA